MLPWEVFCGRDNSLECIKARDELVWTRDTSAVRRGTEGTGATLVQCGLFDEW